jgi:EpsG family
MWPYWVMFLVPAATSLCSSPKCIRIEEADRPGGSLFSWLFVWLATTLLIGLRHEVGGDWANYFQYLDGVTGRGLSEILVRNDPGYQVLNWISTEMDWGIYGVNTMCGALFATGLVVFCRRQALPWLGLAVAIPYMVIVVGMGYSRQGVALGLAMLGLNALENKSTLWFVIWIIVAATFHISAVLLMPIAALASTQNRFLTAIWVGLTFGVAYKLMLEKEVGGLYTNYVQAQYQSDGALVRLLMNAIPAIIYLKWRARFQLSESETRLWTSFAALSLVFLGLFIVSSSSTAVDRVALYLLPLQIVVFARLPLLTSASAASKLNAIGRAQLGVLSYYAVVQFVWLNFGNFSSAWIPYQIYPFET